MNELLIKDDVKIENMIYEIRGKQVMLDSDLAILYNCKNGTKSINLAVKRHINRFPERFMFRLTPEESKLLWFQIETKRSDIEFRGGKYDRPYAFTEQGAIMLSSILKTGVAEQVSIQIMDAFVEMRKYLSSSLIKQTYINDLVLKDSRRIDVLEQSLSKFEQKNNHIFFKGQIYDAYSLMIDIFNTSKESILIIDNYVDKSLLDILSKTDKFITIITNKYNNEDLEKYKKQYKNVEIKISNSFHDRFIIIDNKYLYHSGASFKDLGKKCFSINKIEDSDYLMELIKKIV